MLIDLSLGDQSTAYGLWQTLIGIIEAAFHIGTSQDSLRCTVYGAR